jgi:translocation and assembly module TamB
VAYPLDVTISAPARIFIRGRGLDAELGGALQLQGTTADVATAGRFDLIRGRLDILGKRLVLSEASAQLQGDFDPFIRAVATTTEGDATITITVEGPASAPEVRFSSAPELPEDEILARLLFGRDITQLSALQIANAVRVLSGQSGEGVVGRLRQNFGLDDLDITTNEDGTAGLSVGRYINENVYTDVTVDSTGRSEINLNIQLSPSLTARGSASSDGNTGVGLFFERDY